MFGQGPQAPDSGRIASQQASQPFGTGSAIQLADHIPRPVTRQQAGGCPGREPDRVRTLTHVAGRCPSPVVGVGGLEDRRPGQPVERLVADLGSQRFGVPAMLPQAEQPGARRARAIKDASPMQASDQPPQPTMPGMSPGFVGIQGDDDVRPATPGDPLGRSDRAFPQVGAGQGGDTGFQGVGVASREIIFR